MNELMPDVKTLGTELTKAMQWRHVSWLNLPQKRQVFDEQKKAVFATNSALTGALQDITNQESMLDQFSTRWTEDTQTRTSKKRSFRKSVPVELRRH